MCTINRVFKELGSQALPMPDRNRTLILAPFLPEMTKSSGQKTVFGLCVTPTNTVSTLIFLFRLSYDTKLCCDAGVSVVFHSV